MGGEEGFSKALSESSVTIQEYTARVRENIMVRENVQRFVDANVKVSPEEVKRYYDENKAQFKEPEQVRASHILITVAPTATDEEKKQKRAQIDAALALVKSGTPFAEVAKKFSEDTISARNGGDLGYFNRGQMVAEFENAAFGLKTNQVSDVITSKFGYHVLLVTDHKMPREVGLDEVKDDIEKYLKYRKGSDVTRQHVKQLREVAKVEVLLPAPPPVESAPQSLAPASKASAPVVATPPVAAPTQQNKK
jgi:peptidyl-prolyl cis-trans isomerase C